MYYSFSCVLLVCLLSHFIFPLQRFIVSTALFALALLAYGIVWPLVFVSEMLRVANQVQLADLINLAESASGLKEEDSGRDWEYIVRCAVALVLYASRFRSLSDLEQLVVGPIPFGSTPQLHIHYLPQSVKSVLDAQTSILNFVAQRRQEVSSSFLICILPCVVNLIYFKAGKKQFYLLALDRVNKISWC